MDVANITFLIFTLFSSLRIVSYVPQIHRVALDGNGASAISYSTWSLWTCANIATALYAAINLRDVYLSAVSGIYAFCCVVVIALTMLKRRSLRFGGGRVEASTSAEADRAAALEALRGLVDDAAAALLRGRRPSYTFEQDAAALARQILWRDVRSALRPRWPRIGQPVSQSDAGRRSAHEEVVRRSDGGPQLRTRRKAALCALLAVVATWLIPLSPARGCMPDAQKQSPIELRKPVRGNDVHLASGFGVRMHPLLQITRLHTGVDWAAPLGTPVIAAGRGRVVSAALDGEYGNRVIIDHGGSWRTLYGQLSVFIVSEGDCVEAGSAIGSVGATGLATGPHLHFEVHRDGKPLDPMVLPIKSPGIEPDGKR